MRQASGLVQEFLCLQDHRLVDHLALEIQKFSMSISKEERQLGERLSKLEGEFIVYKIELNRANRVPLLK